jgi:PAS domain S-box-containing protein
VNLASCRHDTIPPLSRTTLEMVAFQVGGSLLRLRSEAALRESEEKYRTLFNTMTQGVVYQDAQGLIIDANPAAERILGLTLDQMQGRTSMDPGWKAVREDGSDFPGAEHPIPVALRTGKEVRNVVHGIYNPKKGSTVWIVVNAIPLFRPGETRPWRAYAMIEDITERKAAEARLLANERRFRELIRNSSDSVTVLDKDGTTKPRGHGLPG